MKLFLFVLILSTSIFSGEILHPISPSDLEQCTDIIKDYYLNWKESEFKTMHSSLSKDGIGAMSEEKLTRQYKEYADWGCHPVSFEVEKSLPNESNVIVTVTVTFSKEVKPNLVNGIYSCHLSKTEGNWKIVSILPPLVIPSADNKPSNSHPGM